MCKYYYFIILFLFTNTSYALTITEIMYNPQEGEEWVEIHGYYVNLSGASISDNYATDEIVCCQFKDSCNLSIGNSSFLVISTQDSDLSIADLCVDDGTIGNGLGNSYDLVNISFNGSTLAFASYNRSVQKGKSLSYFDGYWEETEPTPGLQNIVDNLNNEPAELEIEIIAPEQFIVDTLYEDLFKITESGYSSDEKVSIDLTVEYNFSLQTKNFTVTMLSSVDKGTGWILVNETGLFTLCGEVINASVMVAQFPKICKSIEVIEQPEESCDISLSLLTNKTVYAGEKIVFRHVVSDSSLPFKIEYWIEDIFGVVLKSRLITENLNQKSFTPATDGNLGVIIIKSNLTPSCPDTDPKNNYDEAVVIIKGNITYNSMIQLEEIYLGEDESTKFGEIIRAKLSAYVTNTTKSSLSIWVESSDGTKVSKVTSLSIHTKNVATDITVPIVLLPDCAKKYKDGSYKLVVSGIDNLVSEYIMIRGNLDSLCQKSTESQNEKATSTSSSSSSTYNRLPQYSLDGVSVDSGKVSASIRITNQDESENQYEVWSYVYSGQVSYSGEREENLQKLGLSPGQSRTINLNNFVKEEGSFKLKIKILKAGTKTPYEFTRDISIMGTEKYGKNISEYQNSDEGTILAVPKIKSFYTRSTKHSPKLLLYASINTLVPGLIAKLSSIDDTALYNITETPIRMEVELHKGNNLFQLRLLLDNREIDSRELVIFSDLSEIRTYQNLYDSHTDDNIKNELITMNTTDMMTGLSVTEIHRSSSAKLQNLKPFFVAFTVIITVLALFLYRRKSYKPI